MALALHKPPLTAASSLPLEADRTLGAYAGLARFEGPVIERRADSPPLYSGQWRVPSLCERSGTRLESACPIVYGGNTADWSPASQRLLTAVVDGRRAMALREQGKPMHRRLKGLSP